MKQTPSINLDGFYSKVFFMTLYVSETANTIKPKVITKYMIIVAIAKLVFIGIYPKKKTRKRALTFPSLASNNLNNTVYLNFFFS